ncbi:unnamed protein product [Miscanthus lutarioriparius]|uniref:non-specific serine/threonine protein kinase n=1 Tax=Miscanthus lutarioriparius TaxID=422564 RepID=A0A811QJU1_9POAL|nr:unnamed protein product [Miscanthus lutarioriparius]
MKLGKNKWTGAEWYLTSWRSADDPSPGAYRRALDTSGLPELVVWQGNVRTYRTGPWNGRWFSGVPEASAYRNLIWYQVTTSPAEISYGYTSNPGAALTRVVLTDTGMAKRLCGAFGLCDAGAALTSFCSCLTGLSPASPPAWSLRDTSGGCKRNVKLDCTSNGSGTTTTTTDGFLLVHGVKLPDTHNATVDMSITVEDCMARCLANCSCLAYAAADIRDGDVLSGCVMWTDDIIDLRYVDKGQDLYLRLAKSELPPAPSPRRRPFPTAPVVGASAAAVAAVILTVLLVVTVLRRRRQPIIPAVQSVPSTELRRPPSVASAGQPSPVLNVSSAELSALRRATNDFSVDNVIGRGGFSAVFEGILTDGRKVAVKSLTRSYLTDEGGETFMRQVEVMSKLKHDNLARLLAYCKDGNERILVYEYMENRSLNIYIFARDPKHRALLNWKRRLEIIVGVAKGVAYLHGQEVIHRDLKPSNILLDESWRAKIADFDTAKVFVDDQTNPTLVQTEYDDGNLTPSSTCFNSSAVESIDRIDPSIVNGDTASWNQATLANASIHLT